MAIGSGGEVYDVTLMINHPNEKLDVITEALGPQPDYKWQAGQPRSTLIGTPLPGGTDFQSGAGMCGDCDSVIGMSKEGAAARFWQTMPGDRLQPSSGAATGCGLFVVTDDRTGLAVSIKPVRQGGRLLQAMPDSAKT